MSQYANDFTRTTEIYYEELRKYKPLTKSKERRLLKKCKKGNIKAKNEILESNLKFVFDVAKHYTGRGLSILELISEGNMGLLRAIDKFDLEKDVKFISYAVWWIRQAMLEAIRRKRLIDFVDIEPNCDNDSAIGNKLIDEEDDSYSSNEKTSEDDEIEKEMSENQKTYISNLLNCLNDREREIIEDFYGLNDKKELTLTDISKKRELSIERVRQIKLIALRKLRSNALVYSF
jgi:RNA polymerase primary sigma factor